MPDLGAPQTTPPGEPRGALYEGRVQAALELVANCLRDEEAWDDERLVALLEAVYVVLGGDLADV